MESNPAMNQNLCHWCQTWVKLQLALQLQLLMIFQLHHLPPTLPLHSLCLFTQWQPPYARCFTVLLFFSGFPDSSVGKESACNAGDPGSIPGLGNAGEGIGYPLQYSWASLVAQLVKNLPAMWETWVWSLSLEDPLEKGKGNTHSSILAWRIPWGQKESDMTEQLSLSLYFSRYWTVRFKMFY